MKINEKKVLPENDKWLRDLLTKLQVEIAIYPDHLEDILREVLNEVREMSWKDKEHFFETLEPYHEVLRSYENFVHARIVYVIWKSSVSVQHEPEN